MMDLTNSATRMALTYAIDPLEEMQLDERVTGKERSACADVVDAIKELLEGRR